MANQNNTGASLDAELFNKEILRLSSEFPDMADEILKEAAEYYEGILISNTPVSERSKSITHLKDATLIKSDKKALDVAHSVAIGFSNDPKLKGWMAHFPNKGTVFQNPQNFVDKTNKITEEPISNIFVNGLARFLDGRH